MAWNVFYSYSHKDEDLRNRISTHLAPLVRQQKIVEWYDRKISPGRNWDSDIAAQLESANLILLLISADFLASDYCFGIELDRAMSRLKQGSAVVVPVLLRPCLWTESRFSELQMLPRDAKPVVSWPTEDEALANLAQEIQRIVLAPPPSPPRPETDVAKRLDASMALVRDQVRAYARLYEKTRQRMRASEERTQRMTQIFVKMRDLAHASYPLIDELMASPSPGDRLAAVAILQVFAGARYLPLLVKLVGSEKPFIGYQAAKALQFAVGALDAKAYPELMNAIEQAQVLGASAARNPDSGREAVLRRAREELQGSIEALAPPG